MSRAACLAMAWMASCVSSPEESGLGFATQAGTGVGTDGQTTGMDPGPTTTDPTPPGPSSGSGTSGDGSPKFDVGDGDGNAGDGGGPGGCEKVDFLFVVDNSGSMEDEQQNLVTSFPGFMNVVQQTLMAQDYQVMVVDTDSLKIGGTKICSNGSCTCNGNPYCCYDACQEWGSVTCNGTPCADLPKAPCALELGAGRLDDATGAPCGVEGDHRFMVDGQTDLADTFTCLATVGTQGDGDELPMDALTRAVSLGMNGPGGCNEGFLREDAILVVTLITDEEDMGKSAGSPATWHQALVSAKNFDEAAVVMLGLVGDSALPGGLPGGPCAAYDGNGDGAEDAPALRELVESFTHGSLGSVCAPDYTPFFEQAVSVIDAACDDFVPPG